MNRRRTINGPGPDAVFTTTSSEETVAELLTLWVGSAVSRPTYPGGPRTSREKRCHRDALSIDPSTAWNATADLGSRLRFNTARRYGTPHRQGLLDRDAGGRPNGDLNGPKSRSKRFLTGQDVAEIVHQYDAGEAAPLDAAGRSLADSALATTSPTQPSLRHTGARASGCEGAQAVPHVYSTSFALASRFLTWTSWSAVATTGERQWKPSPGNPATCSFSA